MIIKLHELKAETSNGVSGPIDTNNCTFTTLDILLTAGAGTAPGVTITIEESLDGTNWYSSDIAPVTKLVSDTPPAHHGTTGLQVSFPIAPMIRLKWELVDATSVTFKVYMGVIKYA